MEGASEQILLASFISDGASTRDRKNSARRAIFRQDPSAVDVNSGLDERQAQGERIQRMSWHDRESLALIEVTALISQTWQR